LQNTPIFGGLLSTKLPHNEPDVSIKMKEKRTMGKLEGKVAVVTGASRGVGRGIAISLGAEGATVYVTGRTVDEQHSTVTVGGSIHNTVEAVNAAGGKGIAVQCDHRDDEQVKKFFKRVIREQKQIDILVNNAWAGYEGYHDRKHPMPTAPFWKKPISYWDDNLDGLRWTYISSVFAAPYMVKRKEGLIINISFGVPEAGNAAYNIAKTGTDRLSWEMAHQLKEHGISVVSLYPGLVRTEGVLKNAKYFDMSNSESPEFTGRAVAALAADPNIMDKTGQIFVVAKLAQEYDFDDIDGKRPTPVES
jgi:dehydrogenase/reductase SDR family member 1